VFWSVVHSRFCAMAHSTSPIKIGWVLLLPSPLSPEWGYRMWDSPFQGLLLLYQLSSSYLLLRRMARGLVLPWHVSFPVRMWGQVKWDSPYLWHFDSYLKEHSSLTPFTQNILFLSNTYSQLSSPLSSCILSLSPNLGPLTAKWSFFCPASYKVLEGEIVWADNVSYNKTFTAVLSPILNA
jgi:hypothetical protein